jgi:hypothetical protein
MGVPSKYLAFPDASLGMEVAVTLKRARRVRPQRTKKARQRWSRGVRMPIAKARAAGETPKEIFCFHISICRWWGTRKGGGAA